MRFLFRPIKYATLQWKTMQHIINDSDNNTHIEKKKNTQKQQDTLCGPLI